jgi:hypothetical protein
MPACRAGTPVNHNEAMAVSSAMGATSALHSILNALCCSNSDVSQLLFIFHACTCPRAQVEQEVSARGVQGQELVGHVLSCVTDLRTALLAPPGSEVLGPSLVAQVGKKRLLFTCL